MSRTQKIREVLTASNEKTKINPFEFMKDETLYYIASLRENNPKGEIKIEDLPEPYRTDVLTCYQKAKAQS